MDKSEGGGKWNCPKCGAETEKGRTGTITQRNCTVCSWDFLYRTVSDVDQIIHRRKQQESDLICLVEHGEDTRNIAGAFAKMIQPDNEKINHGVESLRDPEPNTVSIIELGWFSGMQVEDSEGWKSLRTYLQHGEVAQTHILVVASRVPEFYESALDVRLSPAENGHTVEVIGGNR